MIEKRKMAKKCIYCGAEVPEDRVVDFCDRCGSGVWGEKMFNAIISSMEDARDKGDLCHMRMSPDNFENSNEGKSLP